MSKGIAASHVLEGSVRKAANRVRITAQLVDATTGYHRWAERYDRELQDIFAVREEISRKIVAVLAVQLTEGEQTRLARKYTENLEAYDNFLRRHDYLWRSTEQANARPLFERAISLDPTFAAAYTALSGSYWMDWTWRWSQDSRTLEHAFALALTGRLAEGRTLLEEALRESRRMGALYAQSHYLVRLSAVCLLEGAVMRLGSTRTRRSPWPGSTGSAGSRRSRSASSAPSTPKPSRRR